MRQLFFLLPLSYSIPQQVPLIHTQTWTTDIGCMKWDEGGVRGAGLDRRGERNKANPSDVCIGDFYAGQSLLLLLHQLLLPFAALPLLLLLLLLLFLRLCVLLQFVVSLAAST